MPSIGTYGYVPKVNYFFGFPRAIEPGGIEMDLDSVTTFTTSLDGEKGKQVSFVQQTGVLSSTLEHAEPEQMFSTDPANPPNAISAVKALNIANAEGQRIYEITPANQATVLPNINHDSATMSEIRAALAVGKTVITHTDAVSVPGWSGAGYIILDPETGEGAYKIGGLNGGVIALIAGFFLHSVSIVTVSLDMAGGTAAKLARISSGFLAPLGIIIEAIVISAACNDPYSAAALIGFNTILSILSIMGAATLSVLLTGVLAPALLLLYAILVPQIQAGFIRILTNLCGLDIKMSSGKDVRYA